MVSILLVDDEPRVARALEFALRDSDMQVTSLADVNQLDETIERGAPDVILLDIGLSSADGLAVCSRLKQDQRFSDIPVILLSGQVGAATKAAGFEAGADDFIPKPFVPTELVARVRAQVARRSRA
jgi:DNA-binding response OmpR family regulator